MAVDEGLYLRLKDAGLSHKAALLLSDSEETSLFGGGLGGGGALQFGNTLGEEAGDYDMRGTSQVANFGYYTLPGEMAQDDLDYFDLPWARAVNVTSVDPANEPGLHSAVEFLQSGLFVADLRGTITDPAFADLDGTATLAIRTYVGDAERSAIEINGKSDPASLPNGVQIPAGGEYHRVTFAANAGEVIFFALSVYGVASNQIVDFRVRALVSPLLLQQ